MERLLHPSQPPWLSYSSADNSGDDKADYRTTHELLITEDFSRPVPRILQRPRIAGEYQEFHIATIENMGNWLFHSNMVAALQSVP
jgi:hypothetical protein